ncbi:tetratricopeptide repeat protein [uncultured Aquabacterium sp.]|uniref:YfgM family protein n=1 Tax=Aquabacterium sp. TaxID=1872578 RepID=UPI0025F1C3A9|nr:tetratricopeptide repeat protein [uncultured Aquabacterium sp.]
MATFDLEQQEQLDQFKHFWKKYGNLITWTLVLVLGAYAAWTGYLYWQQKRSVAASGLYEEMDRAAEARQTDKVVQAFADLKSGYAGTAFAEQGALLAAKVAADAQKLDESKAALQWLVDHGKNESLVAVARLRLAGLQLDAKSYDDALKTLDAKLPPEFAALADDRRGDILLAQGKKDEAAKAFKAAWTAMDEGVEYRRFIEGKLTSLGQAPSAPQGAASAP